MAFAQQRNHLTTRFSERIPVVKRRISVRVGDVIVTEHYVFRLCTGRVTFALRIISSHIDRQSHDKHTILLLQSEQRYLVLTHQVCAILSVTLQLNYTLFSLRRHQRLITCVCESPL